MDRLFSTGLNYCQIKALRILSRSQTLTSVSGSKTQLEVTRNENLTLNLEQPFTRILWTPAVSEPMTRSRSRSILDKPKFPITSVLLGLHRYTLYRSTRSRIKLIGSGMVPTFSFTARKLSTAVISQAGTISLSMIKNIERLELEVTASLYSFSRSEKEKLRVLGIESSCDDTGAAVLDGCGTILGEALNSQTRTHLLTGGIIPNVAKEMHAQNMEAVVQEALDEAKTSLQELDAIAVTVKPGLVMSLKMGLNHAKKLSINSNQYLIPIHHMEAHALTARMLERVDFPFLVLLASGGHCLLAVAKDIDDFHLLGTTQDDAPGEAFDKTARELKLNTLPEFSDVSGGIAVERVGRDGNPDAFPAIHVMSRRQDCNFSFCGLKIAAKRNILEEYKRQNIPHEEILPNAADLCAWFQYNVTYHMAKRLQRAFIFAEMKGLLNGNKTMVFSGGVASNSYIRSNLEKVCRLFDCQLICPPQRLCTDNGIMIAWNGVEKILSGRPCFHKYDSVEVQARSSFGTDISKEVSGSFIKLPRLKLSQM